MDSHYRDSRQDDESSLGSHCSEVDAVVLVEEAQDELGVETSLSEEKQNEQLNRKLQQLPLEDLHKLVGIASEDERFDAQSKPDLPPYKIRRKIATKVMAKKVTKGYSILEETCTVCDMPLMEGRGKKECRVCPAIKKWMEKNDSDPHDIQNEMNVDAAQTGVVADDQRNEHREEIMSDATPDFKSFMTADIRKRIMDLTPIPERLEFSNEAVVNTTEQPSKVKETKSKPDKSQSTMKSEKKQQEKILEANDKASVGNVDGDATPDFKSFMTADIRKRIMDLTPIPERLEFSNEAVVNTTEQPSKVKETKSKPDKSQSTMKSEKKQQEKILEANDKASVGNVDGSISVEDRARQIIMEVRKKEGWDENAYPNIGSPIGSQVDEAAYYQGVAEARAELIIKRARLSLHKDVEVCSEIVKKSDVATPGLIVKKAKESLRKDDMIDEGSVRHAESIVKKAKESLEKVESPKQRTTAPPLTPMSKLRKKQSSWLNYTASPFKLTSWDAARIIQSFARMVLQRKVFLEHLSDKRTKMYRDMLTGKWKPRKVDIVFESRSKSKEEDIEGGSNEVVQRTDEPAKLREPVESRLVKERWPREPVENREGDPDGQVVRHIDSMHVDNRIEPKNADLRVSVDPVSENDKVETSNADNYIVQAGSYTSTIATRQGNEDVSIVDNGARYTNNAASRFNYEYQRQANTAASSMLDLNQLQIEHQVIDETTSNLPQAELIYDAEVVNASDMVHCSTPMMYAGDGSRAAAMRACIHNPPVFQAEVMKHAGDVANCVNPISAKLVRKNDPPAMGAGAEDDKAQESHHPKRNVFAKVACSFDDAVSKVVSKLTCSGSGEVIGLKSQYKSAPASPPLANGSYFEESRRNAASYSIMYRTSLGWTIVNESCSQCQMPMMKRPDDQKVLCVVCDEADTSDNATLGTMLRSEAPGHGSVISQMRSVAGSQIMKPIEPVPASIGTKNMTNIHIAAPRQRAPIDPEPANDAVSLPPINRSKKKEKKRLKHSSARSCQQHHYYVKENSYGEANMSHQMTAADKAKQQMEDGLSAMRRKMLNYN
ncbi:hypothetical protein ACHAWO_011236 [Cyclotella atomus]|uniref:Uncharacterized protein n=1 Tax=Cyclotella atomus TaxID=382360 RepID=A0ABD3NE81_9STRA